MRLSIVVPAFNEELTIEETLVEIEAYLASYEHCSWWEIVVVNDGSNDNTLQILFDFQKAKPWLKIVDLKVNSGRGKALRSGLEQSSGDIIVSLDADLSYAPYHIERMISKLDQENADIVLASAYCKEGSVSQVPFNRLLISRMGNFVLSKMFDSKLSVLTCIVRAYRKDFIRRLDLHSNNKDIHLEILHKAEILNAKIVEIPADLKWRKQKLQTHERTTKRRSTLKFKKTSSSHFFFALLSRPGLIFATPGLILLFASFFILIICIRAMLPDIGDGMSLFMALRKSMVETATPSWITATFSFLMSIQFFSLGFLTNQNKWIYEETYKTNNAILEELRTKL